jgi:hypothetical protein
MKVPQSVVSVVAHQTRMGETPGDDVEHVVARPKRPWGAADRPARDGCLRSWIDARSSSEGRPAAR